MRPPSRSRRSTRPVGACKTRSFRAVGSGGVVDAPAAELDEEEHVQPLERDRLDGEEVDREHALRLRPQESAPRRPASRAGRAEPCLAQYLLHGATRNDGQRERDNNQLAAARKTRSVVVSRARWVCRRSTASSCRRTTISSSLKSCERGRSKTSCSRQGQAGSRASRTRTTPRSQRDGRTNLRLTRPVPSRNRVKAPHTAARTIASYEQARRQQPTGARKRLAGDSPAHSTPKA
jgi:hypothetical protein